MNSNVHGKSPRFTCYELLWLNRGNGKKNLSLWQEQTYPFPYRSILIYLGGKEAVFHRWERGVNVNL